MKRTRPSSTNHSSANHSVPADIQEEIFKALQRLGQGGEKNSPANEIDSANNDKSDSGMADPIAQAYSKYTNEQLYIEAEQLGIKGISSMTRSQIIDALR